MSVVLAREFRTDVIAALDQRHFRSIRPLTPHSAFRLLPADVPWSGEGPPAQQQSAGVGTLRGGGVIT